MILYIVNEEYLWDGMAFVKLVCMSHSVDVQICFSVVFQKSKIIDEHDARNIFVPDFI